MWRHTRRQMRNSITRLVAAGLAVVLGTAFIAATILSTEVIEATAREIAMAELEGADIIIDVGGPESGASSDITAAISKVPGVTDVHEVHSLPVLFGSGDQERYAELRNIPPNQELSAGTLPTGDGVVISEQLAERIGLQLGDSLTLRNSAGEPKADRTVEIVGTIDAPLRSSSEVIFGSKEMVVDQQRRTDWGWSISQFLIYTDGDPDAVVGQVWAAIPAAVADDFVVRTAEEYTDQFVRDAVGNANSLMWFGLGFAALAIIVAGLVIANTFEVLVAQRTRNLAMLRCVGASKGQVRGTVLLEALILGLLASLLGALAGLGLGQLVGWFLESRNLGLAVPRIADITPWTLIIPVLVGVAVTLVAASGPARAATRVSPIAALRPTVVEPVRSSSKARLVVSLLLIVGGGVLLVSAVAVSLLSDPDDFQASTVLGVMLFTGMLGGLLSLIGVLVGAVYVVPPVTTALGRLLELMVGRNTKATVRLATANAVRNPRRTATTTSALVIGVTLVGLMATGAASARATMGEMLGQQFPADVVAENLNGAEVPEQVQREIAAVPGVDGIVPVSTSQASLADPGADNYYGSVNALDVKKAQGVVFGADRIADLRPGEVAVPETVARDQTWGDGDALQLVDDDGRSTPVTVRVVSRVPAIVVLPETLAKVTEPRMTGLLIAVNDKADLDETVDQITEVANQADPEGGYAVSSPAQARKSFEQVIDALLAVVLGLLAVSVVIALVGIANTLSLSVIERRREHAVLRAVGVTKGQLRGTLAVEGVLLALTGAVVGIVLGLIYGWAGAAVLLGFTGAFTPGVAPLITLGAVVIGVLAGLIASVAPANSAIRVPPVVALAAE
ncbi:ABC transporter permease [Enemella sp. A6]|uniref:ABC transporter permease n=1 Tax=Enemella sp. A6 TaxID=3440152 RepID=UPI003EB93B2A